MDGKFAHVKLSQLGCTKSRADLLDRRRPSGSLGSLNLMRIQGLVEGRGCPGCACWHVRSLGSWRTTLKGQLRIGSQESGPWLMLEQIQACSKQPPPPQGGLPGPAPLLLGPEVLTLILPVLALKAESQV